MALIGSIRKRGTLLLVFVGLSMLAFVLGDFFNRSGPAPENTVAEIGSNQVRYEQFLAYYSYLKDQSAAMSGKEVTDEADLRQISSQAWRYFLEEFMFKPEYEKVMLKTTLTEEVDALLGQTIHPYLRQFFTDPATGQFSREMANNYDQQFAMDINDIPEQNRAAFMQARIQWEQLQRSVLDERRQNKYNNLLRRSVYVTNLEARFQYRLNSEQRDVEYVAIPYNTIEDSAINISESELKQHFRKYAYRFKEAEGVQVQYAVFNAIPSAFDSVGLYNELVMLIEEFRNTEDDTTFIVRNTDNKSEDATYFRAGEMPLLLDSMLFNAAKGTVAGPVVSNGQFVLGKHMGSKNEPDSILTRHIIFVPQTQEELAEMTTRRDSLLEALKSGKANFFEAQEAFSMDETAKQDSGKVGWISRSKTNIDPFFMDTAYMANVGGYIAATSMSGLHIIYVESASEVKKNVLVGKITREIRPSKSTTEEAFQRASDFAMGYRTNNEDVVEYFFRARAAGQMIREELLTRDSRGVGNLPSSSEVSRWALDAPAETVSPVFTLDRAYVVALVVNRRGEDVALADVRQDVIRDLRRKKKFEIIEEKMKAAGLDLNAVASALNSRVSSTINLTINGFLDIAGSDPLLLGAMFGALEGKVSAPVMGRNAACIFRVNAQSRTQPSADDIEFNRSILVSQAQAIYSQYAVEGLFKAYKVRDNRYRFDF
jgi:peptidyl-prolyl cis-trans isomerase D